MMTTAALQSLRPNCSFNIVEERYDSIIYSDPDNLPLPTERELSDESDRLASAKVIKDANNIEIALLDEIDLKSIRDIRFYIASMADAPQTLIDKENEAVAVRARLT